MTKSKSYKAKKRFRYLKFMQTLTDVGMYAAASWVVCLLLSVIMPSSLPIRYAFVILSGLWISSFLFWIKAHAYRFKASLNNAPKYLMCEQEGEIKVDVEILKGPKNDWKARLITSNHPNEKEDYKYYPWLYNPNMKKWFDRWGVQNNIGYYEEELSPIAISDLSFSQQEPLFPLKFKVYGRKRGVGRLAKLKIGRTDPLGWLQFAKVIDLSEQDIHIIPKPKSVPTWPSSRAKQALLKERENSQRRLTQNGEEWVGLREARYNDPMKNTHWKSLAKTGKRWIIEKEERFQSKLALVADPTLLDVNDVESFELLMETLSGQVMNTSKTNEISWIFIDSDPINANGKSYGAWDRVMEKVSELKPATEEETDAAWESFIPKWKQVVALRVITTRSSAELAKWVHKWNELNIDVEIVSIKAKD